MNEAFYKCYYKYFLWNNGLLNHFFSKGKKEILLYVDNFLLEEIGKKAGIVAEDYKQDFISCVKTFCDKYNQYICPKNKPNDDALCSFKDCGYYSNIFCLKRKRRADVLEVANHINLKNIKYYDQYIDKKGIRHINSSSDKKAIIHSLPFFAIIIYIILKFDDGEKQIWDNVGPDISAESRTFIPELWEGINKYDERFDKDASVYVRSESDRGDYAGRILYHLPLSSSTRNKIQDAIYKSSAWKLIDTISFLEIVGLIMNSLKDVKANAELKEILLNCYSQNDYKGISARKVQSAIDDFDIDIYESKINDRREAEDYKHTVTCGEFALGIYFPTDDEETENSIVLLTTVQQQIENKGFTISEGRSGTIAGYNTFFVKHCNKIAVQLKEYSLIDKNNRITPLPIGDVIFFYQYDENLYIQTRSIKSAKSYIVAVRNEAVSTFDSWCISNKNNFTRWPQEVTCALFGNEWTIFYTESALNGQYYQKNNNERDNTENSSIILKGGIKKKNTDTYFINALPYFEIPAEYNPQDARIYINLNGSYYENYSTIISERKIIIDITEMPIKSDEVAYLDMCIELDKNSYAKNINVCGQTITYNPESLYKFDKYGNICEHEDNISFHGNNIGEEYKSGVIQGLFKIDSKELSTISEDFYFTNLLAACCYADEHSEISHSNLRKCISYAATRLKVDIQHEGFISNVKRALNSAGIINIDYSTRKCQAIPPSFMLVPFSKYQTSGSQLKMLGGLYTRAFLADLLDYCVAHNVSIDLVKNESKNIEDRFLPPIVLLGHNFNSTSFCKEYNQQCDVIKDYDYALSLLNMVPSYNDIYSHFSFKHNDSYQFLPHLEPTPVTILPRLRSMKGAGGKNNWFIEKPNNKFAEVDTGFISWASIVCHHGQNTPMVIVRYDSVYIPKTLLLPNYVQRALYLMNLGVPELTKVFICGAAVSSYYSKMYKYTLYSEERCKVFASQISSVKDITSSNLVRNCFVPKNRKEHRMELWTSKINGNKYRQIYLVLYDVDGTEILAVAHDHKAYVKCNGHYRGLISNTINEAFTFLIKERWQFLNERKSIGYSKNGGQSFEVVFCVSEEELTLPTTNEFVKETIKIL